MDLQTIIQEISSLKTKAAKLNAEISSSPTKEIKKARVAEYMHTSANIAELKQQAATMKAEQAVTKVDKRKDSVKLTTLFFPADKRVQYFATTAGIVDLLVLLREVFEEGIPAVTSYYSVPPEQEAAIPEEWYELVKNE